MKLTRLALALGVAGLFASTADVPSAQAKYDAFTVPSLVYRTGAYAPNGIPVANGFLDYFNMLNERDGGIEGIKVNVLECETAYNTKQAVECYENTKNEGQSGALAINPRSTGATYALIPKTTEDKIPLLTLGYGRTSAANGKVFPYIFNPPGTYWSQATVFIKYIAQQEGGMENLKGKKIALVYHNSAYGKEPIKTLETLAAKHGFELMLLPVDHPGQEQKATWLQVRRGKPDWLLMWGWGVMNQVAIKEAAAIRFPMDKFIGVWWSGSENDVAPSGPAAKGYLAGTMHAPGSNFGALEEIRKHLYAKGKGAGEESRIGEVLYNRGLLEAVLTAEAIRNAIKIHGTTDIRGEHVRDGFEAIKLDDAAFKRLDLEGFMPPIEITCENHEGNGKIAVQQWDPDTGKWTVVSDWIEPMRDLVNELVSEDSAAFAAENNITPRQCN
ncbi:MAG: ABC transporter substrate-binding protein [Nisaea sp.]|nr:ABC transporter substrate-binding protein [Nisaea sp.]